MENREAVICSHKPAVVSLQELDHAHDGADEDQYADDVKREHVSLPRPLVRQCRRPLRLPDLKNYRRDDEHPEEKDLHEQAANHYMFSGVLRACVTGCQQAGTACLHEEGEDVAADEDLGQPGSADEERFFAVDHEDDAAELHVYRRGEEGRGDEDEGRLDDVRS